MNHIPETDEEVEETTAYESDENDQKPWLRYTEATAPAYKDKAHPSGRTKQTQGKKQPQMPPVKEHFNEKKREKAIELKNETRTEFNYPNGARVLQVATNTINARDTEVETKKETEREPYMTKKKANRNVFSRAAMYMEEKKAEKAAKKAAKKQEKAERNAGS